MSAPSDGKQASPGAAHDAPLTGKVALVTGGSRGLGRGIAEALAGAGAHIVLTARDADQLAHTAAEMIAAGYSVETCAGSATAPSAARDAVETCLQRFGGLDILVNNAGVAAATPVLDPEWDTVRDVWELNFFAPWRFASEAWRAHMAQHGGTIVNISSTAAFRAREGMEAYAMSKAALCDFTRRLAIAAAPGVRVNGIAPGIVATDGNRALVAQHGPPPNVSADGTGTWPLRRPGAVDDVAAAALYLVSPASGWVTGQVLVVDGGAFL